MNVHELDQLAEQLRQKAMLLADQLKARQLDPATEAAALEQLVGLRRAAHALGKVGAA